MRVEWKGKRAFRRKSTAQFLVMGFAILITSGALLLNLPWASNSGESVGFLDALFTATSASCVTGQVVVNTARQWTWFGRIVIISLIQIGGIGVMTLIAIGMMMLRRHFSMRDRMAIQAAFNQEQTGGMVRFIINVIKVTFIIEAIGTFFLTIGFYFADEIKVSFGQALVWGLFHSVSAFCNAGFDIIGDTNMSPYVNNPIINITLMLLIISGGLGYPVWIELAMQYRKSAKEKFRLSSFWTRLSVHSKMAITFTAVFVFGGALMFMLIEWNNPATLGSLSLSGKTFGAFFQSVTLRTAGFNTIDQAGLYEPSQFFSVVLMIVGGSPASTAGGMKTVTFGVIFFAMFTALRGKEGITAFKRELPINALQKALTVTALVLTMVIGGATLLYFTELNNTFEHSFLDLLVETSSVSSTVGITAGITPYLSSPGKIILIACMFIGRLGPVTIALALTDLNHRGASASKISYAESNVIIG